jgi:hypothetical protein
MHDSPADQLIALPLESNASALEAQLQAFAERAEVACPPIAPSIWSSISRVDPGD